MENYCISAAVIIRDIPGKRAIKTIINKKVINMLKQSTKLAKSEEVIKYYNNGNNFYDLEKYEEALVEYDKVIELKPDYVEAYYNKGNSLSNCGRYEEAIKEYNKAIELKPDYAKAINNKSMVIEKLRSAGDAT